MKVRRFADQVAKRHGVKEVLGLGKDSVLLGGAQVSAALGQFAQVVFVTHQLGVRQFGRFALVVGFVTLVGQFFDVRASKAAVVFGRPLAVERKPSLIATLRFAYKVDLATALIGFCVLLIAAPLVAPNLVGFGGVGLMSLYAVTLIGSSPRLTSISVLQISDRYEWIAAYGVSSEIFRIGMVAVAVLIFHSLTALVVCLVIVEISLGLATLTLANRALLAMLGRGLFGVRTRLLPEERRPMLKLVLQTNILAYSRIAQSQLPLIVVGALAGPFEAGVYKVALAAATVIGLLSDPAFNAVLPRFSAMWARRKRTEIATLIRHASVIAWPTITVVASIAILMRIPILRLAGGEPATAGEVIFVLGVAAQAINGALFWNSPLLMAAGRASVSARLHVVGMVALASLIVPLVDRWGGAGAAVGILMFISFVNVGSTISAVRLLRRPPEATNP